MSTLFKSLILTKILDFKLFKTNYWQDERKFNGSGLQ